MHHLNRLNKADINDLSERLLYRFENGSGEKYIKRLIKLQLRVFHQYRKARYPSNFDIFTADWARKRKRRRKHYK